MTEDPKKKILRAIDGLDLSLEGLLGTFGDALKTAVTQLEQANSDGADGLDKARASKGPVRVSSGIRVRVGGQDISTTAEKIKPINPARPTSPATPRTETRDLTFETIEDHDGWLLTAEMPGVSRNEVNLSQDGEWIALLTTGAKRFCARLTPPCPCPVDRITITLNNGILTLQFPKGSAI